MAEAFSGTWLLTGDPEEPIMEASHAVVPWVTNTLGDGEVSVFPDIAETDIPEGRYDWFVLIVPAGDTRFDDYYLWLTYFDVGRDCSL